MSYPYQRSSSVSYILYDSAIKSGSSLGIINRDVISNLNTFKNSLVCQDTDSIGSGIHYSITPKLTRKKKQGLSFALVNPTVIKYKDSPYNNVRINLNALKEIEYIKQCTNGSSSSFKKHLLRSVLCRPKTINNSKLGINCGSHKTLNEYIDEAERFNKIKKRKSKFKTYQKTKTLQLQVNSGILRTSRIRKFIDSDVNMNEKSPKSGRTTKSVKDRKKKQFKMQSVIQNTILSKSYVNHKLIAINAQLEAMKKCHYTKKFGPFAGFCAFTFKNHKEKINDKVDIFVNKIITILSKEHDSLHNNQEQISLHYFGLHHGIGGDKVSKLLKESFHRYLFNNPELLSDTIKCIYKAYDKIEYNAYKKEYDSFECGSSSLIAFVAGRKVFLANIGNSKCIISLNHSFDLFNLVNSHSPKNTDEMRRLQQHDISFKNNKNGKRYKITSLGISSSRILGCFTVKGIEPYSQNKDKTNILSTISKGGIIYTPEITEFTLTEDMDFMLIINDTISFYLTNKEIALIIYSVMVESIYNAISYEKMLDSILNTICREAIDKGAKSNLSIIFIPMDSFNQMFEDLNARKITKTLEQLKASVNEFEALYPKCFIHKERLILQQNCSVNISNNILTVEKPNFNTASIVSFGISNPSEYDNEASLSSQSSYKGYKYFHCDDLNNNFKYNPSKTIEMSILKSKKEAKEKNYKVNQNRNKNHYSISESEESIEIEKRKKKGIFSFCGCFV
jgi:serine/threonine protein phosphatase PrpC